MHCRSGDTEIVTARLRTDKAAEPCQRMETHSGTAYSELRSKGLYRLCWSAKCAAVAFADWPEQRCV